MVGYLGGYVTPPVAQAHVHLAAGETLIVTVERTGRTYTLDETPVLRRVQ